MLSEFRQRYPLGSLITELVRVEQGIYIVRAQAIVQGTVLGSGLAGSTTVEEAEDAAVQRALRSAGFEAALIPPLPPVPPLPSPTNGNGLSPKSWVEPMAKGGDTPNLALHSEPEDFSDLIAKTDVEMRRVGWGQGEGRRYLKSTFSKTSRHELSDAELQVFLQHLKQLPTRMLIESESDF